MAETLPLGATAAGALRVPSDPHALVVVADLDPTRDKIVRNTLHQAQFATLQIDPRAIAGPTTASATVRWLTDRLITSASWIGSQSEFSEMSVGIYGSDFGGAAAIAAAAARPHVFRALVLRDGRPHLAGSVLNEVRAATLLIVDEQDDGSISMNQETMTRVKGIAELEILPEFPVPHDEETMAHVAQLARRWFDRFLA